jgi:coenzyme F420-reducing hydrogenase delta subunit
MEYILTAFASRAEGVLVISCHEGNCYSEKGTAFARNSVNQMMGFLKHTRASQGRIEMHTLAANMGKEFSDITNQSEKQLTDMGPMHT